MISKKHYRKSMKITNVIPDICSIMHLKYWYYTTLTHFHKHSVIVIGGGYEINNELLMVTKLAK